MPAKLSALLFVLAGMPAFGQGLSVEELLGEWEFTAYAEKSAPDERTPVAAIFVFRPNGVLITRMRDVEAESTYTIEGNTFRYRDSNGEQVWTVREFEPGVSIVMENASTLMYLERR
jgi:hypothetical protein